MTVAELMQVLQTFPKDAEIEFGVSNSKVPGDIHKLTYDEVSSAFATYMFGTVYIHFKSSMVP